jgi:hypothetical protein
LNKYNISGEIPSKYENLEGTVKTLFYDLKLDSKKCGVVKQEVCFVRGLAAKASAWAADGLCQGQERKEHCDSHAPLGHICCTVALWESSPFPLLGIECSFIAIQYPHTRFTVLLGKRLTNLIR